MPESKIESHQLLALVLKRTSAKAIASDLGISLGLVYKWSEHPTGSGTNNPIDRVAQLMHSTNDDRIINWLCESAGGTFTRK